MRNIKGKSSVRLVYIYIHVYSDDLHDSDDDNNSDDDHDDVAGLLTDIV